jgi:hypothetical protein
MAYLPIENLPPYSWSILLSPIVGIHLNNTPLQRHFAFSLVFIPVYSFSEKSDIPTYCIIGMYA